MPLLLSFASGLQILSEFLDAFQKQSRPVEQLVQAASLLILPMLEAGYDAGENVVDEESLTTMVNTMFDQQDGASSACTSWLLRGSPMHLKF